MNRAPGTDPASPASVYGKLQHLARQQGRPTDELLTLYALERVLDRLTRTRYRDDLVLKGGVLLAAYRLRRPTRDIDVQLLDAALDRQHLTAVVTAISAVPADDGLVLNPASSRIETIRDEDEYSGLRVHLPGTLHTHRLDVRLDVSTADPIWPAPIHVVLPGLLGQDVALLGHPLVTVVAEKTVTMLQRGTVNTRWRDFVDVRSMAREHSFIADEVWRAASAVAEHRQVTLGPLAGVLAGYPGIAQPRWRAWRSKQRLEDRSLVDFGDQLTDVLAFVDPVYAKVRRGSDDWDPRRSSWTSSSAKT